jgi:hypothetical protein
MFTATHEEKDGAALIRLTGSIDEQVDFEKSIGPLPPKVEFACKDIIHINSLGVKAWMDYFAKKAAEKISFSFSECPPPIVEQLNYILHFACGGKILSVSVPFSCEQCHRELRGVVKCEDLKRVSYKLPAIKCPKCNAKAHFDDAPEAYFAFLIRQ